MANMDITGNMIECGFKFYSTLNQPPVPVNLPSPSSVTSIMSDPEKVIQKYPKLATISKVGRLVWIS